MAKSNSSAHVFSYNGELIDINERIFGIDNRAFRYGDGIFESLRIIGGKLPLWHKHYERMVKGCALLKLKMPAALTDEALLAEVMKVMKANNLEDNGRVRISVFRKAGGFYLPENNEAEFTIEVRPVTDEHFSLNKNGLSIDLYTEVEKPVGRLSTLKTSNALIYVLAAIYREEKKLDDCLLINWKSRIIESIDSNIFLIKADKITTPPLAEGCVAGVMRAYVMELLNANGHSLHEESIDIEDLFSADGLILTNAVKGIRWVSTYKTKEYACPPIAEWLSGELDKLSGRMLPG